MTLVSRHKSNQFRSVCSTGVTMGRDRYRSFADLRASEVEGVDFRCLVQDRGGDILIMAPHGGRIEPHTSKIAGAIAADDLSLFLFEGLRARPHRELHITSHKYDDPTALQMAARSNLVLAIHGCRDRERPMILIGGLDQVAGQRIKVQLKRAGYRCSIANSQMSGKHPNNICNMGRTRAGIQLEIPKSLRKRLAVDKNKMQTFALAIRTALNTSDLR